MDANGKQSLPSMCARAHLKSSRNSQRGMRKYCTVHFVTKVATKEMTGVR